ncbi:MAG: cation-translocating P-type ATPase [Dehalococcoidales bacterium]|nr:cation-translocating P-type ATPase [Dehalococcoidales bacterium]
MEKEPSPASLNLNINRLHGLTADEASARLKAEGYNELPSAGRKNVFSMALEVMREPMFLLLIACGIIYLFLGDIQEALILLFFVFVIIGITFYQERKTERTLEALRDLSSPRALVVRDGEQVRIVGREVVRGDILILAEGDRVPTDAIVISSADLCADESLLTGESVPVRKAAGDPRSAMTRPGGDDLPGVFSGTLIVRGQGIAEVKSTGINTEMGKIGRSLQKVEGEDTLLQKETRRLVRNIAAAGIAISLLIFVVYWITRGDWQHGLLAGLTLGMAILPEEFPVVLTIFLALGAWRLSQKQVLTRSTPAVETMGATTVLCVDKTGTLTQNRMSVAKLYTRDQYLDMTNHSSDTIPERFHELIEYSILASEINPSDPMEKAFKELGNDYLSRTEHLHSDWELVGDYNLTRELLALSHVWKSPSGSDYIIASKGAPEAVADLCHFNRQQREDLAARVGSLAEEGLRILGVAKAHFRQGALPEQQHDFSFEFIGLVGLADPVRSSVPAAIAECYQAGVRVAMITGDYPATAQAIARQVGLTPRDKVITGNEIEKMDDAELQKCIQGVNIFARVMPEHKLRIVNALKANGEIVAMTGDGVNDAPALKSAHIGIAMGGRGTDVAREAAAIVLLDDDFSSIVQANRLGRRIFDNLRKAMAYIFAVHIPIIGLSLLPVLLKWPLVLFPVHIVFLELIIDPACTLVFEAEREEADVMRRPPRNPKQGIFNKRTLGLSLLQGLVVALVTFGVYAIARYRGLGEDEARGLTYTTLVLANLGLILSNRSWTRTIFGTLFSKNAALWYVAGFALVFLALVLSVPPLRELFSFDTLSGLDIAICAGAALLSIAWFEVFKIINKRSRKPQPAERHP